MKLWYKTNDSPVRLQTSSNDYSKKLGVGGEEVSISLFLGHAVLCLLYIVVDTFNVNTLSSYLDIRCVNRCY